MKQSIAWHEQCLKNVKATLEREMLSLAQQEARVAAAKQRAEEYERQILLAIAKGKDGFDSDRFGK